jgi:hypothetical protein
METTDAKIRELAEKDERYVWHALSRYTPTEGGGSAPAPRMIVAEGEGGPDLGLRGQPLSRRHVGPLVCQRRLRQGRTREDRIRAATEAPVLPPH